MTPRKKTFLTFTITLVAILVAAAVYLFVDSPFPNYSTTGLAKTESTEIKLGKAVLIYGDSLNKNILS